MLSKQNLKSKKGASKVIVAIIIAVIVLIAIIGGIVALVLLSKEQDTKSGKNNESSVDDSSWDTETEISTEEKNDIKEKYLGVFSLLLDSTDKDKSLTEVAIELYNMNRNESSEADDSTLQETGNTVTNETTTNSPTESMVNDTIVITGDNPLNTNTTTSNTTNTTGLNSSAVPNMNINSNNSSSETLSGTIDEGEIAVAINEINGQTVEDLSSAIAKVKNEINVVPGYVTDIISISKANGVYDITYKVCFPREADLIKYGTIDKMNTAAIDRLESNTVNIKLVKNKSFEYSQYKIKSIEKMNTETPTCYYLSYSTTNQKFGVIDQSGNIIIQNIYSWIDIPNNYKDIFVCNDGTHSFVLNKIGEQLFTDYTNVKTLASTAGGDSFWYENDFLIVEKNGKFGAIDFDGFEIFEPIYDSITPLYYLTGKIIVQESGKQALADITGKVISNFKYSQVGILGGQLPLDSMVNSQRTLEQVQKMVEEGYYIVGQESDGTVETIQIVKPAEYNVDFSSLPEMNYPADINGWTLMKTNEVYLLYVK